ncbi:MAG: DUF4440 domain-containing protein [Planctomycetaceae bacterium]
MAAPDDELLQLTHRLLDAIAAGDWSAYTSLVASDVTCFEPEARGHLVEGRGFHEYYFRLAAGTPAPAKTPSATTIVAPRVRIIGADAAVVSYVRLVQKLDDQGKPVTVACEETRVWQRTDAGWRHVHFHRSSPG